MFHNISGVILAGGTNKRFDGKIKAKIIIEGKTIISRIIETIGDIFDEIILVTNTPKEFVEYRSCKIIGDRFLNKGPLAGIHSAMKESDREALFVVGGDMPLINKEVIYKQVDWYKNNKYDVIIPKIDQYIEPLHGIYRKTLLSTLETYLAGNNNYALHEFLNITDVHYLQFEGSEKIKNTFTNINSYTDILLVRKILGIG